MRPSANFVTGKTSRSLKAAYRVVNENLAAEVAHLDGGMVAWCALHPTAALDVTPARSMGRLC